MEDIGEIIRVETIEQYQFLIDRVRKTKQPVKISLAQDISYYVGVDAKGVKIELGLNFDILVPDN
jgi:hypothetical protein